MGTTQRSPDGSVSEGLYALGTVTRATFWEITAVPDIRIACERLAQRLLPGNARVAGKIAAHA